MTMTKVDDWSTTAEANTDVAGYDISPGSYARDLNNAIQNVMGQAKSKFDAVDTAVAAEATLARNASSLDTGTVSDALLPLRLSPLGYDTANWDNVNANGDWKSARQQDGVLNTPMGATAPFTAYYWQGTATFFNTSFGYVEVVSLNDPNLRFGRWMFSGVWGSWFECPTKQTVLDARYAQIATANAFTALQTLNQGAFMPIAKSVNFYSTDYGIGTPDGAGLQLYTGGSDTIRFGKRPAGVWTEYGKFDSDGVFKIGGQTCHHDGRANKSPSYTVGTVPSALASGAGAKRVSIDAQNTFESGFTFNYNTNSNVVAFEESIFAQGSFAYAGAAVGSNAVTTIGTVTDASIKATDHIEVRQSTSSVFREVTIHAQALAGSISITAYNGYSASKTLPAATIYWRAKRAS